MDALNSRIIYIKTKNELMNKYNFNNKKFALVDNSKNGEVNTDTIFEYKQDGDLVTADYAGGTVKYGKIIAHLNNDELNMVYQCLTIENELKAGKAIATISTSEHNKIQLKLKWQWLTDDNDSGESEYIEI